MTVEGKGGRPSKWDDKIPEWTIDYITQAVTKWEEFTGKKVVQVPDGFETLIDDETGKEYLEKKYKDEVQDFQGVNMKQTFPTIPGLAIYLFKEKKHHLSSKTLKTWIAGDFPEEVSDEKKEEFSASMGTLLDVQEEILSTGGAFGGMNAPVTKFLLANNHGYTEKQDLTSGGDKVGLFGMTSKEIREAEESSQ